MGLQGPLLLLCRATDEAQGVPLVFLRGATWGAQRSLSAGKASRLLRGPPWGCLSLVLWHSAASAVSSGLVSMCRGVGRGPGVPCRVLLCLKRALKIANAAQQMASARGTPGAHVLLLVEILNK